MTLTATITTLHTVTFDHDQRGTTSRCTCGWLKRGTRAEVFNAAAVHDIDQWEVEAKEPRK